MDVLKHDKIKLDSKVHKILKCKQSIRQSKQSIQLVLIIYEQRNQVHIRKE